MRKTAALAWVLIAAAAICRAEPRWSSVSGNELSGKLVYPRIARAARVSGVVLGRVIFLPSGEIQSFDFIGGPPMLSGDLARQRKSWIVETDAQGSQPCVTSVIADFQLDDSSLHCEPSQSGTKSYPIDVSVPSILRLKLATEVISFCDPGGYMSRRSAFRRVGRAIGRILIGRIFRRPIRAED
jgi:hypothetical protein